jgi:hypothetical protein
MNDPGPHATARSVLKQIRHDFVDDGCSNSPDGFFMWAKRWHWSKGLVRSFKWCCKIHDWRYCSRCHPAGTMHQEARTFADTELGWNVRSVLQFTMRWFGWLYWKATSNWGGRRAWNSCGPASGERCRHNMPMPEWMQMLDR